MGDFAAKYDIRQTSSLKNKRGVSIESAYKKVQTAATMPVNMVYIFSYIVRFLFVFDGKILNCADVKARLADLHGYSGSLSSRQTAQYQLASKELGTMNYVYMKHVCFCIEVCIFFGKIHWSCDVLAQRDDASILSQLVPYFAVCLAFLIL